MTDWYRFWNRFPGQVGEQDYLAQVGHTLGGRPYNESMFGQLISGIVRALEPGSHDHLLDLCCGNGVITSRLASHCASVVGIDFSRPLLDVANRAHRPDNVTYVQMDVKDLASLRERRFPPFSRVLMYGALQHLDRKSLSPLLRDIVALSTPEARILIGGIPDLRRRSGFLDSVPTRLRYYFRLLAGRDRIGTWWCPDRFRADCLSLGLECAIDDGSENRPGGHYRFDALITRTPEAPTLA